MLEKPQNPRFSSGPTTKHPGWSFENLQMESLGRSHRSAYAVERLQKALKLTRDVLDIPDEYRIAIVPGSCTGAIEMAMWNLLGPKPVDMFSWGIFGSLWVRDVVEELKLKDTHLFETPHGFLPDLNQYNPKHDCLFTWNETTTGVTVPHSDWIPTSREGLVLCDATSALFAQKVDWSKLDATAFAWQKCLGGEAGHGMLVLSPRAVERLESYTPPWPIPRLFRIKKDGKLIDVIFDGMTIVSASMLCVEDVIDALSWCQDIGGLDALIQRSQANFQVIEEWVNITPWVEFLAQNPSTRSTTSICLALVDVPESERWSVIHRIRDDLGTEGIAYDIAGHKYALPCLRIWGGPTVEADDIRKLLPWIEKSYINNWLDQY